jgi:hypothetical protein
MERITQSSGHRRELLASEHAVCYHCSKVFPPSAVEEWTDEDSSGVPQTAICPFCSVDAVVGFSGQIDPSWLKKMYRAFE